VCGVGGLLISEMERTLAFQNKEGIENVIRVMRPCISCIFERPQPENDQGLLSEN